MRENILCRTHSWYQILLLSITLFVGKLQTSLLLIVIHVKLHQIFSSQRKKKIKAVNNFALMLHEVVIHNL